ncbi:hypothetical protein Q9R02_01640 [Arthrobacter sp. YJM1]|uniref:Uncharacterized protein n=1 Tax=Arthrobacter horti TaxID=3068273 RepID=A0ABT9IJV1_9MICC|nr:hypothetical protein [Arthrobacter sp. YJM1]MDP5225858.1 hypothetical protein [Arthrobacter sp. YJM1]
MCRAVKCAVCGKTTWSGCGEHVAAVKSGVAVTQWCDGRHSAAERAEATTGRGGLFARIFGR